MPQNTITPTQTAEVSRLDLSVESARVAAESSNFYGGGCGPFSCNRFAEEQVPSIKNRRDT